MSLDSNSLSGRHHCLGAQFLVYAYLGLQLMIIFIIYQLFSGLLINYLVYKRKRKIN